MRRNNRQIHKGATLKGGIRKRNQGPYTVKGFRLFDSVRFSGSLCFVTERRTSGYFALRTLNGTRIHDSAKAADLTLLEMCKGCIGRNCRIIMKLPGLLKLPEAAGPGASVQGILRAAE